MANSPLLTAQRLRDQLAAAGVLTASVRAALTVASDVHSKMVRDDGTPYLDEHVYPIASAVADYARSGGALQMDEAERVVIVALLHDVLEDSPKLGYADIEQTFNAEIATDVRALTKPPKIGAALDCAVAREQRYIDAVRAASVVARTVKVFDRLNNLACIHKSSPEKRARYLVESEEFHLSLAMMMDPHLAEAMRLRIRVLREA
jgi:(p)ppGpp synthase/HD superfamily hydrolase